MTRDFNRDLTIMVAGSGNITMALLEESMGDWIFPNPKAEREVHVIFPVLANMGGALRNLVKLGKEWEFKFTVVHPRNGTMTKEISALPEDSFIHVEDEREALEAGLSLLTAAHKGGDETAFIHAYNPESTYEQGNNTLSDYEIIGEAKNYQWLQTLNLCEGLVDSFEGFKTTDEILKEERLKKEFEDKQRAEEAAKPKPAKKTTAPRKRAQKKAEPQESKPLVTEPEKPLEDVPVGTVVEVAGTEFVKVGPNPFHAPLPGNPVRDNPTREDVIASGLNDPAVPLYDQENVTEADEINRIVFLNAEAAKRNELSANVPIVIGPSPDIQEDIREAHAQVEKTHTIVVSKVDLAQLSTDIKGLTAAFGNIMDTFTRILKDG